MVLFKIIQYSLISIAALLIVYQLILVTSALVSKKNESFHTVYNRSFLVIIPCHNMSQLLAKTLYSLSGLIYPWNLYKLVILADNCSDKTVEIARRFGLQVLEKNDNQNIGDNSIKWALGQVEQWDEKFDAIVVIKTGSLISSNYLQVMNYYLEKGSEVVQSSDLLLAEPDKGKDRLVHLIHLLHNYMNPLGQKALGFNTRLSGNGMCFKSSILMKYPSSLQSIEKEQEYTLFLSLKGISVDFAPEARIWIAQKENSSKSKLSKIRSPGFGHSIINRYAKLFFSKPKWSVKILFGFIMPPTVKLILGILAVLIINIILWLFSVIPPVFIWIWLVLAILEAVYIYSGIMLSKAMLSKLNGK
ncbi:MAG TPA: glycosyltransferase family 2 protein [Balneolaceae bacterium]|nr:glycosyltransferase family 2 protein [Balneolaceae bacterium]